MSDSGDCQCIGTLRSKLVPCIPTSSITQDEMEANSRSNRINRQLKQWHSQDKKRHKLLLLGTGESGKTTITKQMKIIHINGFDRGERLEKVIDIKRNVRDSIAAICGAMYRFGIPLENPDYQEYAAYVQCEQVHSKEYDFPQEFFQRTLKLWKDGGVQKCFRRAVEYQLLDSAEYFMERIPEIRKRAYVPTDQDILRCRVMTNTIQKIDFEVMDRNSRSAIPFSVFDVGGQRGERRKWIQAFDKVTAILFLVDLSCFDVRLREDETKNRLLESLDVFHSVWNNRFLKHISVLIFFNKIDVLKQKIDKGHSLNTLLQEISYQLEHNPHIPFDYYAKYLLNFPNFRVKSIDRKEFIDSFPVPEGTDDLDLNNFERRRTSSSASSKSRRSCMADKIGDEVIRTAAFIKSAFTNIVSQTNSISSSSHSCETFYTCAVNTDNIQKIMEGCRGIIIKEHLRIINIDV